jgi:hypothetical protein
MKNFALVAALLLAGLMGANQSFVILSHATYVLFLSQLDVTTYAVMAGIVFLNRVTYRAFP